MRKSVFYLLALLVLISLSVLLFNHRLFGRKKADLEDALVRVDDLSELDFHLHYQETYRADFYDLPGNLEISKTTTSHVAGEYKKDENRAMSLSSRVTQYVDNAAHHLEDAKKTIVGNLGGWQLEQEFVPEFETSSFYEYRKCVKATDPADNKVSMMCVVASIIGENHLFVLVFDGNGAITKDEVEYILEVALKDKQDILKRLP